MKGKIIGFMCLSGILVGLFFNQTQALADSSPGVCVLDVTPGSFEILWQADPNGSPSLTVYTDKAGTLKAGPEIAVGSIPLHGGDSEAGNSYEAMVQRKEFRDRVRSLGLYKMRVSGLKPETSYYFKAQIAYQGGQEITYPSTGTRAVTTPGPASFVSNASIITLELDNPQGNLNAQGYVVSAFCPKSRHGVSAYVEDGALTNTVCLNLANVFSMDSGNWRSGQEEEVILVVLRGVDAPPVWATVSMHFDDTFAVAQSRPVELETTESGSQLYEAGLGMRVLTNHMEHPCACAITDAGLDGKIHQWDVLNLLQQAAGY